MTINICKNPDSYSEKHNAFMMTAIKSYPGITVKDENSLLLCVDATDEATEFLRHLNDCDMIIIIRE